MTEALDLAIVGGGPAGMAAARVAASHGLTVAVVDEQQRPGGQILRRPPEDFRVEGWLEGRAYRGMKAGLAAFEAMPDIEWLGGRSVIGLDRERGEAAFILRLSSGWAAGTIRARHVLVAAGCYDLPVPLPGWTLPGVMAAGGVQAFIKSQQIVPGERFVLAGTHPLMLVVAAQIVAAGGAVAAILFDQPRARMIGALLRHPQGAAQGATALATARAAQRTLARAGVPIRFGQSLQGIEGDAQVTAARLADGTAIACDRVALCYGFLPQSDLPRLAGAAVVWAEPAGGWRTSHDGWMQTDVAGLFVAGETSGVAGADIAALEGELAGIGIARADGRIDVAEADRAARRVRGQLASARRFAAMLAEIADPREALSRPVPPETILCRCEDVCAGDVDAALDLASGPNAIKLMTRIGMGLCQGRSCEAALLRRIAAAKGTRPGAEGGFTARYPIRPVRIGDLVDVAPEATKQAEGCD